MYCSKCGNEISDDSRFCKFCGNVLTSIEENCEVKTIKNKGGGKQTVERSRLSNASLALGVVALLLSVVSYGDNLLLALIMGIIGVVLGIRGGRRDGSAVAIAGSTLSVLAILISVVMTLFALNSAGSNSNSSRRKSSKPSIAGTYELQKNDFKASGTIYITGEDDFYRMYYEGDDIFKSFTLKEIESDTRIFDYVKTYDGKILYDWNSFDPRPEYYFYFDKDDDEYQTLYYGIFEFEKVD